VWKVDPLDLRVELELRALPTELQGDFVRIATMLENGGPGGVGMPQVRSLGRRLWEMRMRGRAGEARAIYTAVEGQRFVVLHAFMKKSRTTKPRDLRLALRRLKDL
jgi:phage-related protein